MLQRRLVRRRLPGQLHSSRRRTKRRSLRRRCSTSIPIRASTAGRASTSARSTRSRPTTSSRRPRSRTSKINAEYFGSYPIGPDWPELRSRRKIPADLGTLRVAIVGSGPAACYAAQELTTHSAVQVDIFDRLPTPYGLVRAGVAPDHQSTKGIANVFRSAIGHKNTVSATSTSRWVRTSPTKNCSRTTTPCSTRSARPAIGASAFPARICPARHAATEFVAWYNGHPDYAHRTFDLSGERAVIIGNGNVALDVARDLVMNPDELARTDMAEHAVEALRNSKIRRSSSSAVAVPRRPPTRTRNCSRSADSKAST